MKTNLKQLDEAFRTGSEPGWDDDDAQPTSQEDYENARKVVETFDTLDLSGTSFRIEPLLDGGMAITIDSVGSMRRAFMMFREGRMSGALIDNRDKPTGDGYRPLSDGRISLIKIDQTCQVVLDHLKKRTLSDAIQAARGGSAPIDRQGFG